MENTNQENQSQGSESEKHTCDEKNCQHNQQDHSRRGCCGNHEKHRFRPGKIFVGLLVLIFGVALLAHNFGYINLSGISLNWSLLWPIIIIFIGLSMLSARGWFGALIGGIFTILVMCLVFTLVFNSNSNIFAKPGDIKTQTRTVAAFDKIDLSGIGELNITQGDTESLSIEAPENILKNIETKVDDNVLEISYDRDWPFIFFNPTNKIKFDVTTKNIERVKSSGATSISSNEIKGENLNIEISGASKVNMNVEVKNLESKMSGAGQFTINGSAEKENIIVSGAGQYNGRDLVSQEATVKISGAGSATINASNKLDVKISGAGKVDYLGDPQIIQDISGAGRINKIN